MNPNPEPKLSAKLIEKLNACDLGDLARILAPPPAPRVDRDKIDEIPTQVDDEDSDRWSPERVDACGLYAFHAPPPPASYGHVFLATDDWKNVAVPLNMLAPEYLGDPKLKRWHWWRGEGAEQIRSQETARAFATEFTRQFHGLEAAPTGRIVSFDVKTLKAKHSFMTRSGWYGLWCEAYMAPEGAKPDGSNPKWFKILGADVTGEKPIRKFALAYARKFDKQKHQKRRPVDSDYARRNYYLDEESRAKVERANRYLDAAESMPCSESRALRFLIHEGFKSVPPESEWKPGKIHWDTVDNATVKERKTPIRQQQVLDAAKRLTPPGGCPSYREIGDDVGITKKNVEQVVRKLRKLGIWPYPSYSEHTEARRKSRALESVRANLGLLDPEIRKRLLDQINEDDLGTKKGKA